MVAISTIERETLKEIFRLLESVGIDPQEIYPDTALIQENETLILGDRFFMDSGDSFSVVLPVCVYDAINAQQHQNSNRVLRLNIGSPIQPEGTDSEQVHFADFLMSDINEVNIRQAEFAHVNKANTLMELWLWHRHQFGFCCVLLAVYGLAI